MNKSVIKARQRLRELLLQRRLETGFSMLEAVVVVGVLLALAVSGFFAYGPITENAKKAKVRSAASEVHTAVLVASIDGDSSTEPQGVLDNWNSSTDKIRVAIIEPTAGGTSSNGDFCVSATNVETPSITARTGACSDVPGGFGPGNNNGGNTGGNNGGTNPGSNMPIPAGALLVNPTDAINVDGNRASSGYGTTADHSVMDSWGVSEDRNESWAYPNDGDTYTLSYLDKSSNEYVDYYTHVTDWNVGRYAEIVQRGTTVFASVQDQSYDLTADEIAGFGKMQADGGKISFVPWGGNGNRATVIMGPASVTITDPDQAYSSGFEQQPAWGPIRAQAAACYGNPDMERLNGQFVMDYGNVPVPSTDFWGNSMAFDHYGKVDEHTAGVVDINAPALACKYTARMAVTHGSTGALTNVPAWNLDYTYTVEDMGVIASGTMGNGDLSYASPGDHLTYNFYGLYPDEGTNVKLSYYDPGANEMVQFYTAPVGDGTNGTVQLSATYQEEVVWTPNYVNTNHWNPIDVQLSLSTPDTSYADAYREMAYLGGTIEFIAGGKTVTITSGYISGANYNNYGEIDPFWTPPGDGGGTAS